MTQARIAVLAILVLIAWEAFRLGILGNIAHRRRRSSS